MNTIEKVSANQQLALLKELRARLIYAFTFLFSLFAVMLYFANTLYTWLAIPLLKFLPQGHLIATQLAAPFLIPFKLAFVFSFLVGVPFFMYQIWAFVSPALYKYERKKIWPFLMFSTILFYMGLLFAYFVIFPMLFQFLSQATPTGVMFSPDISEYFDFTIKILLIFGILFEIPMIMMLLVASGIVTHERFIRTRSYAIVGAFILGMLLAPPDIFSLTILAIPIWILYELGVFLSRFVAAHGKKD